MGPHSYDPGVSESDVFWTTEIPESSVTFSMRREEASLHLRNVRLFDVFRSEVLGPNKKSLAFGLRFRAPDRTLTDEEVGGLRQRLIDAMAKEHGAVLRG